MENTEINKMMNKKIIDTRQSFEWSNYLTTLGWRNLRTSKGISLSVRRTPFGSLVKIQKPVLLSKEDVEEINDLAAKEKAFIIKLEPYAGQDLSVLAESGYEHSATPLTPTKTMYIDLSLHKDKLWERVTHSGKYSINRAKREGATVEFSINPKSEEIEKHFKVTQLTGRRKSFYVPPMSHIFNMAEAFKEGCVIATVFTKEGEVAGSKMFVGANGVTLFSNGGTAPVGLKDKSGYALMWESILQLKALGYHTLDLEGLNDDRFPSLTKAWGGFSHFKEKFGGDVITFPYPQIRYKSSLLSKIFKFVNMGI